MPAPNRGATGALAFSLAFPSLVAWLYFVVLADAPGAWAQGVYTAGKAIQFSFPLVWALAAERWRPTGRRLVGAGVAPGLGFGGLVLAAMLAVYHLGLKPGAYLGAARPEIREKLALFGVDSTVKYLALAAFYSLVHSGLEEYYWRWFVFGRLRRAVAWPVALLVSSIGFMAHHVIVLGTYFGWGWPGTWFFSLGVAAGGAVWAWIYHQSGSLAGPWLSHLLVDAAIFMIGWDLAGPL
ncbi:MAG: CPBP family intramembrane glutamic endopeptidase [Thermoguttaceae bacterium]